MRISEVRDRLRSCYHVDRWWPSTSPWEVMVGALLTQQTNWTNVLRSIETLKTLGLMDVELLASADAETVMEAVRPCGFFRQKTERLQAMARCIRDDHGGEPMRLLLRDDARDLLLEMKGIGPETADSILVFAARRPNFVAANYCGRILGRTGSVDDASYQSLQDAVHEAIGRNADELAELYALLVEHAKRHCTSTPRCEGCPLHDGCAFIA